MEQVEREPTGVMVHLPPLGQAGIPRMNWVRSSILGVSFVVFPFCSAQRFFAPSIIFRPAEQLPHCCSDFASVSYCCSPRLQPETSAAATASTREYLKTRFNIRPQSCTEVRCCIQCKSVRSPVEKHCLSPAKGPPTGSLTFGTASITPPIHLWISAWPSGEDMPTAPL